MNFKDTLLSVELVIETNEVPLIIGESGIGKTALAKELAQKRGWSLVVIDGNLLKEGEIGGLPTVEEYEVENGQGKVTCKKRTVYAVHGKLQEIDELILEGKAVFLFIDEINRCEHTVQQELMNLILNREINGYKLHEKVKIAAAMNPSSKYGEEYDYQVTDMDAAQENRFVWLYMESDSKAWIDWAYKNNIEKKVIEFISTFSEYLHNVKDDEDIKATPRSFERVSKSYSLYKNNIESIPKRVFLNILKGNLGNKIAHEFITFIEEENDPLLSYEDIFERDGVAEEILFKLKNESHTRLYLTAKNIFNALDAKELVERDIVRLVSFIGQYPVDLRLGMMQEIKENHPKVYALCLENEGFLETYFQLYNEIEG